MGPLSYNEFERRIEDALKQTTLERTPDCIEEERLWEFAAEQGAHQEAERIIAHLAICLYCYQGYAQIVEAQRLTTAPQETAPPTPSPSLSQRLRDWLGLSTPQRSLQMGGLMLATGLAVFVFCFWFFRPKAPLVLASQHDQDIEVRNKKVEDLSKQLNSQAESNKRLQQEAERVKQQLAASQAKVQQQRKFWENKLRMAHTERQGHTRLKTPDLHALTFVPLKDAGINDHDLAGDKDKDPLPFALHQPLPGATVRHDVVVFQWDDFAFPMDQGHRQPAGSYRVEYWRPDHPNEKPNRSLPQATPFWQPTSEASLLPGSVYAWHVIAYLDAEGKEPMQVQSPQGDIEFQFRTLSQVELAHMAGARGSLLQMGALLANAGMLKESEQAFETYLIAAPNDAGAQNWLRKVRQLRQEELKKLDAHMEDWSKSVGGHTSQGVSALRKQIDAERTKN